MRSIIQNTKECYICKKQSGLHLHHIYYGKNRAISDKNGFVCYLCYEHHEGTNGVHGKNGDELNTYLKRKCQEVYETNGKREDFMKLIGKSFL